MVILLGDAVAQDGQELLRGSAGRVLDRGGHEGDPELLLGDQEVQDLLQALLVACGLHGGLGLGCYFTHSCSLAGLESSRDAPRCECLTKPTSLCVKLATDCARIAPVHRSAVVLMELLLVESATASASLTGRPLGLQPDRRPSGMAGLLRLVSGSSNRSNNDHTPHGRALQLAPRSRGRSSATRLAHADSGLRSVTSSRCFPCEATARIARLALSSESRSAIRASP